MNVATRDAFDRRVQRHVEAASERQVEARRQIMAEYAARGLLRSGPRLKRQAQVRNEELADLVEWCLSEVAALPGVMASHWNEHGHAIRGMLTAFMADSRAPVLADGAPFGAAAEKALAVILDKGDACALAELDEFGSGVWRPRSPSREVSMTNNTVNVGDGATIGSIQQAGDHAHQQSAATVDVSSIQQALDQFERAVGDAAISEEVRSAICTEIETIRPQLKKPEPSAVIVREGMKTLRNIVEGVAGGLLTPHFAALMTAVLPLIGAS